MALEHGYRMIHAGFSLFMFFWGFGGGHAPTLENALEWSRIPCESLQESGVLS